jgi:hypothetical protein
MLLGALLIGARVLALVQATRHAGEAAPDAQTVLLVGVAEGTDLFIRALERDRRAPYRVIGILSLRARQAGRRMQGHLILGTVEEADAVLDRLRAEGRLPALIVLSGPDIEGPALEALLDAADRLCAFNGARFDLAFLRHSLGVSAERVRSWRLKLHDVYEGCRLALCVTFPLDALLAANGLEGKTGSGKEAIAMAQEGRWDELAAYCSHDTRVTHRVSSLDRILLPKTHGLCMTNRGEFRVIE